jgi:hypothetical protein
MMGEIMEKSMRRSEAKTIYQKLRDGTYDAEGGERAFEDDALTEACLDLDRDAWILKELRCSTPDRETALFELFHVVLR